MKHIRVILAAGGTGGHIFPALSLAEVLVSRGYSVLWITDKRGMSFEPDNSSLIVKCSSVTNPSKPGLLAKIKSLWHVFKAVLSARNCINEFNADIIIGFGGYPSVAPVLAAFITRKPVILHEQNSVLGRANRLLSLKADVIATSFDSTLGARNIDFKTVKTGNPVRSSILAIRASVYPKIEKTGWLNILVIGGSLGARVLSEVIPEAVALLPKTLSGRLQITQQCRKEDIVSLKAKYTRIGKTCEVNSFFEDIPLRIKHAHLVISRAGASTVAELCVAGRPAIFVPFRLSIDNHQAKNASALVGVGGAWSFDEIDLTASALAKFMENILNDERRLIAAASAAYQFGVPEAVENLADLVSETVEKKTQKLMRRTFKMTKAESNHSQRLGEAS